jgi:signal transduction histidine kinase
LVTARWPSSQAWLPLLRLGDQRVGPADGHGLGLTIVKAIVTAHGANLAARPDP